MPKHPTHARAPGAFIQINERDRAYLDTKARLTSGCHVALVYRKRKPQLGRYWPGSPPTFAECVDHWDHSPTAKLRKRKSLPPGAKVFRWIETHRRFGPPYWRPDAATKPQ